MTEVSQPASKTVSLQLAVGAVYCIEYLAGAAHEMVAPSETPEFERYGLHIQALYPVMPFRPNVLPSDTGLVLWLSMRTVS